MDVLQLPTSLDGNQYTVVFVDYFMKKFLQKAETIARLVVEQIISHHGVPEKLLLVHEVCKLLGTTNIRLPPSVRWPSGKI